MIITVASGKGGTGKTTIATSLAQSLAKKMGNNSVLIMDCDVEAPNAHLFLKPIFESRQVVHIMIPQINEAICTHCGVCAQVCQYHAIAVLKNKTLVFPQLCHGCGSCTLMCPETVISEIPNPIGQLESGVTNSGFSFARGVLDIGEPMAVPIIRQLKQLQKQLFKEVIIRDAPPGTSCTVVETVRGSDFLLLVTEPTPFGLHDLKMAIQVGRELNVPIGVIVNRDEGEFPALEEFCLKEHLPILMRIPFERAIAEGIARGQSLVDLNPDYEDKLYRLYETILHSIETVAIRGVS